MLIIHSRARPHLEMLEATNHNLSRIFSLSTNVKVDVYVLTAPNARAKIHPRPQDRMVRGLLSAGRRRAERSDHGLLLRCRIHSRAALGRDLLRGEGCSQSQAPPQRGLGLLGNLRGHSKASKALKTIVAGWSAT